MKGILLAAFLIAGQSADIATTCHGLRAGYVEGNPVLPRNCIAIAAVKGTLVASALAVYPWVRTRHPKWAVAVLVVPGATGIAAASFNIHLMLGAAR